MRLRILGDDLLSIDKGFYHYLEIPCDIGGRGFELRKVGNPESYHVRVGDEVSCECLGFLRHNACKHVMALTALVNYA